MTVTPRPSFRLIAVLVVALGACGGGDDADGPEPGDPATTTETTISPIGELMGWENVSPEESQRRQLAQEELIAECMRSEGWEYTPVDYSAMSSAASLSDEEMALANDPAAYGRKYGYGVVQNYEQYELPGIESGGDGMEPPKMDRGFEDPNQPYVDSLTESERADYEISLYGDPAIWEGSEEEGFVAPPPEEMGCAGQASAEIWGSDPTQSNPDIQNRMNDYWENVESDPRLQDAYAAWRDCMGDTIAAMTVLDVPVERPEQIGSYFNARKYELMEFETVPYDADADDGSMGFVMPSTISGLAYVGEPTEIPAAGIDELRDEELAVWQEDHDCQQEAGIADVRHELEQEFTDQLRAEFPELTSSDD